MSKRGNAAGEGETASKAYSIFKRELEDRLEFDLDWHKFDKVVEVLKEMGAPITLQDLANLIESKISGHEAVADLELPKYTLTVKKIDSKIIRKTKPLS